MKALVENGQIVEVFRKPKAIDIDGVRYPDAAMQRFSRDELLDLGIYDFVEERPDPRFYEYREYLDAIGGGVVTRRYVPKPKALEDADGGVDEKGKKITILGLKSNAIAKVKAQAAGLLTATDWYSSRERDENIKVPFNIKAYRAAVRAKSNELETLITNCSTLAEFIALHENTEETASPLSVWPDSENPPPWVPKVVTIR